MPDLNLREEVILAIGNVGGDAGYSILTSHGIVHVPGNNPEARDAYAAFTKSFAVLQDIALKERGENRGEVGA